MPSRCQCRANSVQHFTGRMWVLRRVASSRFASVGGRRQIFNHLCPRDFRILLLATSLRILLGCSWGPLGHSPGPSGPSWAPRMPTRGCLEISEGHRKREGEKATISSLSEGLRSLPLVPQVEPSWEFLGSTFGLSWGSVGLSRSLLGAF